MELRVQSAPLNQFIATRMFFYIYHPAFVNDFFKTKLDNVSQSCPDLVKYDPIFHISECCERSPNSEFGHLNQHFANDARFQGKFLSVTSEVTKLMNVRSFNIQKACSFKTNSSLFQIKMAK